jgi:hypothetical protein
VPHSASTGTPAYVTSWQPGTSNTKKRSGQLITGGGGGFAMTNRAGKTREDRGI